jgi:hypothetical protein
MSVSIALAELAVTASQMHGERACCPEVSLGMRAVDAVESGGSLQTESQHRLTESWVPIPGYEGRYDVSDLGRVRSLLGREPRVLKPYRIKNGRFQLTLRDANGRIKHPYVYQVVLLAFRGPPPPGMQCRHVVENDLGNNALANLEYGTPVENAADKRLHGTHLSGSRHPRAVLSDEDVASIIADARPQVVIARAHGISQPHVSSLKRGVRRQKSAASTVLESARPA